MPNETFISYGILLALCVLIGVIYLGKKRKNIWISIGIHGMSGIFILAAIQYLLPVLGYENWVVTISPKTLICSGILGIPGVLLLYGVTIFCHMKI